MRKLALLLGMVVTVNAQPLYRVSQATLVASTLTDHISSKGLQERNLFLRNSYGRYHEGRGLVVKLGLTGGVFTAGEVRRERKVRKWLTVYNFAVSAVYLGVATHNSRIRR